MTIELLNMDFSISPKSSFYHFVNGGWLMNSKLPKNVEIWNPKNHLLANLKNWISISLKNNQNSLVANLFKSGLKNIENLGLNPLVDILDIINEIDGIEDVIIVAGELHKLVQSNVNYIDTTKNTMFLSEPNLGMPDKSFYLDDSNSFIYKRYATYIRNLLITSGQNEDNAVDDSNLIIEFERKLAELMLDKHELMDFSKIITGVTLENFHDINPELFFDAYLSVLGMTDINTLSLHRIQYFCDLSDLLLETPIYTLKSYFKFHLLSHFAPYLSNDYASLHFGFMKSTLYGIESPYPREEFLAQVIFDLLPDAIGKLYYENHFDENLTSLAYDLIDTLVLAFEHHIHSNIWMHEDTKYTALMKLDNLDVKVGYPQKWTDYTNLELQIDSDQPFISNIKQVYLFRFENMMSKINKPVDHEEWAVSPLSITTSYCPGRNEIYVPGILLQNPFFFKPDDENSHAYMPMNLGAIGTLISQEINNALIGVGRYFDSNGSLSEWWLQEDIHHFEVMVNQLLAMAPQTEEGDWIGEKDIIELAGVEIAFDALERYLENYSEYQLKHPKFTPIQQFFIAYTQTNRALIRSDIPYDELTHVKRVNGLLSNFRPFYEAFGITKQDPMFIVDDCRTQVWL
ncbi:hypothetical protein HDV02_003124 [Globomyces sp. JEL0801]|nr:hypothetical protein HDV02_003124 [Globomyces sp. JEL0801]